MIWKDWRFWRWKINFFLCFLCFLLLNKLNCFCETARGLQTLHFRGHGLSPWPRTRTRRATALRQRQRFDPVRAKNSSPDEIRAMAEKILPITKRTNVGLVINDHLDIAREIGADICHLGQEDFFDAGYKHCRGSQKSEVRSQNWFIHARPRAGTTCARCRGGLPCHRAGVCDGYQAGYQAGDA